MSKTDPLRIGMLPLLMLAMLGECQYGLRQGVFSAVPLPSFQLLNVCMPSPPFSNRVQDDKLPIPAKQTYLGRS